MTRPRLYVPVDRHGWPPSLDGGRARALATCRLLDRLEQAPPEEIARFLAERVSRYVRHLVAHMEDLRVAVRARGSAGPIKLGTLPVSTRATLRDRLEGAGPLPLPPGHGEAVADATSGSTGVALRFYRSTLSGRFNGILYLHDHFRQGRDLSRPMNILKTKVPPHAGEHHDLPEPDAQVETGAWRLRASNAYSVESHADWLRRHPAPYLVVHPRALAGILDTYAREGRPAQGVEQILTLGETVDGELRRQARELLGARIVDRYSTQELGAIAFQCPHRDEWYHVAVANAVVEVVDERGAAMPEGVPGRVLVTGFNNWASPLLRYELGDIAALHSRCACGAHLPALTQLLGRRRELVRLPNGERRYLRVSAGHWLDIAPVREWRLTQREPFLIEAEVVCAQPLGAAQRHAIVAMLQGLTDPAFRIEIVERASIDWGPSYKRADVVSLV